MKANIIFNIGLAVDALFLLLSLGNILMMQTTMQGTAQGPMDGLSGAGRLFLWLIPLFFALVVGLAFWLKKMGKILPANILLWVPALPLLLGLLLWGGLAVLFMVSAATK